MIRPALGAVLAVGLFVAPPITFGQQPGPRPPRTFSEFAGIWVSEAGPQPPSARPDCGTSPTRAPGCTPVGGFESNPAPAAPLEPKLVITTSPTQITLATIPRAPHGTDVFRFDGVPTNVGGGQGTVTLVAGAILLTVKSTRMLGNSEMTLTTTDLLSVTGDVLTIERQYTRTVRPTDGDKVGYVQMPAEGQPADTRVKCVYRRKL